MATLFSVRQIGQWMLPIYRPTRVESVTIRELQGLEFGIPKVLIGKDPVQRDQTGPLTIEFSSLGGGYDDGVELLIPRVKRQNCEQAGPPPFFNIWARVWRTGSEIHVRVDSDQNVSRQQVGWVSFMQSGSHGLIATNGNVLIQLGAQSTKPTTVRL